MIPLLQIQELVKKEDQFLQEGFLLVALAEKSKSFRIQIKGLLREVNEALPPLKEK